MTDSPLFQLVKTRYAYYLFDVNSNTMSQISQKSYQYLHDILYGGQNSFEANSETAP